MGVTCSTSTSAHCLHMRCVRIFHTAHAQCKEFFTLRMRFLNQMTANVAVNDPVDSRNAMPHCQYSASGTFVHGVEVLPVWQVDGLANKQ